MANILEIERRSSRNEAIYKIASPNTIARETVSLDSFTCIRAFKSSLEINRILIIFIPILVL